MLTSLHLFLASCTVPGYTSDPVLGCYRVYLKNYLSKVHARDTCDKDGGRILLINSSMEASILSSVLSVISGIYYIKLYLLFIRGTWSYL